MYYLALGLLCLLTVAFGGGRRGWTAAALALAAFGYAFLVYRWWVPPAAAAVAALAGYGAAAFLKRRASWQTPLVAAGLVLAGFSVLGPRDGLF